MAETREQMAARMEKASVAVYLACEKTVADDISAMLRAGAAALRAQGWLDIGTLTDGVVEPDSAEWWRQVAQGLSVEIAKLQSERPRCEWRPFPGGPQCFRHAGHGLPHQTRSDES